MKQFLIIFFCINSLLLSGQIDIPVTLLPLTNLATGDRDFTNCGSSKMKNIIIVHEFITVTELDGDYLFIRSNKDNIYDKIDNSDALQRIIDLINTNNKNQTTSTVIYFPAGTYNFRKKIDLLGSKNIIIKGAGAGKTIFTFILKDYKKYPCINVTIDNDNNVPEGIGFEDFTIQQEGIECITKINANNMIYSDWENITFNFNSATNCWIRGIESFYTHKAHVNIENSTFITVCNSYFHEANEYSNRGGTGYGVMIQGTSGTTTTSKYNLIENNIFNTLRHAMVIQSSAQHNVLGYNYSADIYAYEFFQQEALNYLNSYSSDYKGDILFHGSFNESNPNSYNLVEGNYVNQIHFDSEDSHGSNGIQNTFYRNYAKTGFRINENSSINQYKQNIIGCNAKPIDINEYIIGGTTIGNLIIPKTFEFIRDNGWSTYWWDEYENYLGITEIRPNWTGISSYNNTPSFYLSSPTPNFWYKTEQNVAAYPYNPDPSNLIPAYIRNNYANTNNLNKAEYIGFDNNGHYRGVL